jgi:hypothetical protein
MGYGCKPVMYSLVLVLCVSVERSLLRVDTGIGSLPLAGGELREVAARMGCSFVDSGSRCGSRLGYRACVRPAAFVVLAH